MDSKLIFYLVLIYFTSNCLSDDPIEVILKQGNILGKIENTIFEKRNYYSFRGIPYAEPPVGELRFKPPKPHQGWFEPLKAFDNKPTCMQFAARMRMHEQFGISGSEDCLFISVYTPNLEGNLPVMVFDYNDMFHSGFNGSEAYSPENFIEDGVIVVTITHRLGLFGYLTTEDNIIPANNGLRDFILGLHWVKDNIKKFGGDPDKVTLMGSCGGGSLVNMLLYSEKAKGLFSGAIIQSGSAFEPTYFYKDSKAIAFNLGKQFDVETDDSGVLLEVLQKATPEELLTKVIKVLERDHSMVSDESSAQPFKPIIERGNDDAVLSALPEEEVFVNDVPVIIGFNSREGLDYSSHLLFNPTLISYKTEEGMLNLPIRVGYGFKSKSKVAKEAIKEIVEFYIESKNLDYRNILEHVVFAGDTIQGYSLNYATKKLSKALKSPVYYYLFDFRGQLNQNSQYISRYSKYTIGNWGATVTDELCYLFVCNRIRSDYIQLSKMVSEQNEKKVLKKMVRMWTNFAKTGNPTPIEEKLLKNFIWKPTSKEPGDLEYLHITKNLKMAINPLGEREKFWDQFIEKYRALSVDGIVKDREEAKDEL